MLETCGELKIKINTQKRTVRHVGHLSRIIYVYGSQDKSLDLSVFVTLYLKPFVFNSMSRKERNPFTSFP